MSGADRIAYRLRPAANSPSGAIVLLHGRAVDEHDLVPLIDALDPTARLVGVAPRGPLVLPPGGAHWYAVHEIGYPDPETFHATYARMSAWLDALPELTGAPLERTVVGGFSQGAVMAYALGLGSGRLSPAGVLALAGYVPTVEGLSLDLDRTGLPVAIGHGAFDPVIGVEWARQARDLLGGAGLSVTYGEGPVGHTVDPRLLGELVAWVEAVTATS